MNSSCVDLNIMNDEEDIIQSKLILQDKNKNALQFNDLNYE